MIRGGHAVQGGVTSKKADWIQLPVKRYLAALPTVKQGVITDQRCFS